MPGISIRTRGLPFPLNLVVPLLRPNSAIASPLFSEANDFKAAILGERRLDHSLSDVAQSGRIFWEGGSNQTILRPRPLECWKTALSRWLIMSYAICKRLILTSNRLT